MSIELEKNTTNAPNIHLLWIVAIGHDALWCSIPSGGDIFGIWSFGKYIFDNMFYTFTGAEIGQFHNFISRHEYILWFDIPMKDSFFVNIKDGIKEVMDDGSDFVNTKTVFFAFIILV